jgi:hypothetical protein
MMEARRIKRQMLLMTGLTVLKQVPGGKAIGCFGEENGMVKAFLWRSVSVLCRIKIRRLSGTGGARFMRTASPDTTCEEGAHAAGGDLGSEIGLRPNHGLMLYMSMARSKIDSTLRDFMFERKVSVAPTGARSRCRQSRRRSGTMPS